MNAKKFKGMRNISHFPAVYIDETKALCRERQILRKGFQEMMDSVHNTRRDSKQTCGNGRTAKDIFGRSRMKRHGGGAGGLKRLALYALLLCLLAPGAAVAEESPAYEAVAGIRFHIRKEPESEYRIIAVEENEKVDVYEYGAEWCRVGYGRETGWAKTKWLWGFRSLDAGRYPVPGAPPILGVVSLEEPAWIAGGGFGGLTADAGSLVCVSAADAAGYTLPVWRGTGALSPDAGALIPFVAWADARPGDLMAGFTTYYNERTGGSLAAARAYNIALGCQRIDGTVIEPNSAFSFNAACAPYKRGNGYQKAPNISDDGVGYGGGVCQVTTTLYNAILGLPLQINDWAVHRRSGVQYVPQYFDAAVGSYSDLAFTNTLPYAIRLSAQPQNGAVTVLIYRAEEN